MPAVDGTVHAITWTITMIIRIWRGWTRREDADAYRAYMARVALPGYADVGGNRAVYMTSRPNDDRTEFTMITVWDSMEVVTAFAGEDPARAVFYPDDDHYLVDREWTVTHHHVYASRVDVVRAGDRSEQ